MKRKFFTQFRFIAILVVAAILVFPAVQVASAAVIVENGTIAENEVINDDVFIGGENVVVNGTVNGLLMASGTNVTINGKINGDLLMFGTNVTLANTAKVTGNLFAGAQSIEILGQVDGSVFGGSSMITLLKSAMIKNNLYYGGFSMHLQDGATVGRDLLTGAYQAIIDGEVQQDAKVAAAAVEVRGKINRNAILEVGDPGEATQMQWTSFFPNLPKAINPGLRIDKNAKIGGKLTYTSKVDQKDTILAAPIGGVELQAPKPSEEEAKKAPSIMDNPWIKWAIQELALLVTLLVFGALIIWLLPERLNQAAEIARTRTLASAGAGILTILAGYFAIFLAIVIIILVAIVLGLIQLGDLGWAVAGVGLSSVGLISTVFGLVVNYVSKIIVAFMVGYLLLQKIAPNSKHIRIWATLVGIVIYVILNAIPILGWLVALAATIIGLGAVWFLYRKMTQKPAILSQETLPPPADMPIVS